MLILFSLPFDQQLTSKNSSLKLLLQAQPACVSEIHFNFCLNFKLMLLIDMLLIKQHVLLLLCIHTKKQQW